MLINIFLSIIKTNEEDISINQHNNSIKTKELNVKINEYKDFYENNIIEIRKEFIKKQILLKEIKNDFKKMMIEFNRMFIDIINNLKKEQENNRLNIERNLNNLLSFNFFNFSIKKLREKQIKDLFLKYLLCFYDVYSYRINYKIEEFSKLFNLLIKINKLRRKNKKKEEENNFYFFEDIYYYDLFYFIKELEKEVSIVFNISIDEIRRILYGKPYKNIYDNYIQSFYNKILEIIKQNIYFNKLDNSETNNIYFQENEIFYKLYNYHYNTFLMIKREKQISNNLLLLLNVLFKYYEKDSDLFFNNKIVEKCEIEKKEVNNLTSNYFIYISYSQKELISNKFINELNEKFINYLK